jgi:hypothetical protein
MDLDAGRLVFQLEGGGGVPSSATARVLPSVSTVRPIMEVPCSTCMA